MSKAVRNMIIRDPSKYHLLATEMKLAVIQAAKNAVNIMGAQSSKEAKKNIRGKFTTRNNFTTNRVGFTPMTDGRYTKISAIQSVVGIDERASYMARQEEGGDHTPQQGSKLSIPTDAARGGSFRQKVKIKVRNIRKNNARVHGESSARLPQYKGKGKIPGKKKITTHTRKSLLVSRAYIAFKHNLFLPMGGSGGNRNVFRITSFATVGKGRHRSVVFDKVQIYNFEHTKTHTKEKPWLLPAAEKVAKNAQKIFNSQMRKLGL